VDHRTAALSLSVDEALTQLLQQPPWLIPAVVCGAVTVLFLVFGVLVPLLLKQRLLRKATLNENERYDLRKQLLTYVKAESPTKGIPVNLGRFWRGKKLSAANRFVVLDSLFGQKTLQTAYSGDAFTNFFQVLWWGVLARPPLYVKLSDRDWNQLANGQPISIAIETLIGKQVVDHQENYDVKLKDIEGSAIAIGKKSSAKTSTTVPALTPEQLALLITALKTDAVALESDHPEAAEEAASAADALESDLKAERFVSAARKANVLFDFIQKGTGAWSATMTILKGLGIGA